MRRRISRDLYFFSPCSMTLDNYVHNSIGWISVAEDTKYKMINTQHAQ